MALVSIQELGEAPRPSERARTITATYFLNRAHIDLPATAPVGIGREVEDMDTAQPSRIIGKKCAAIPQSVVCTGAGEPAER